MSNDTLYRTPVFSARIRVSSAVSTQLCSEFGPGSFTAKDRKDLLIHCDRHCDDYEQEVAHLQSQLLYIRQQQKRLKNHEATLRSQNSPVRKIPNAILEIIFNLACERNLLQEYPWRNATQSPPTTISSPMASLPALSIASTCSRWRKVAMSTPSLWSRLRLEVISGIHLSHHDPFIHAVMLHLRRAQKCPLDIDLYVAGKIRSTCATILILTSVASDWKAFKYDGDLGFGSYFPPDLNLPLLERVENSCNFDSAHSHFVNAPKLRKLDILQYTGEFSSRFPWSHLTDLRIMASSLPFDKLMDHCPNLSSLTLIEGEDRNNNIFPITPARTFERLSSLTVVLWNSMSNVGLLGCVLLSFTLPSLTELQIDGTECLTQPWPERAFANFISRSSCKIAKLSVLGVKISDEELVSALLLLPALQDLNISEPIHCNTTPITSEFISSFHSYAQSKLTGPNSPLVPRLRHLSLDVTAPTFDDAGFVNMVMSRWLPDPKYASQVRVDCLRSVVLRFHSRKVNDAVYEPLWYLDRMGLMVVVRSVEKV